MTLIDVMLHRGLPSDLAYVAYLDAWDKCHNALEKLLLPGEDVQIDLESITAAIKQAEDLANEANSEEPRLWKPPFPGDLFSEMIQLARKMRIQMICILTVACESAVVDGKESPSDRVRVREGTSSVSKKKWFNDLIKDEDSGWPDAIRETFEKMNETFDIVKEVAAQNGQTLSIDRRPQRGQALKTGRKMCVGRSDSDDEGPVNLVDSKATQISFVYECLQTIKSASCNLQLAVLQKGLVS